METLSHPYDDRSPMLSAFIGFILAYLLVAAVLLGTAIQGEKLAHAAPSNPTVLVHKA